MDAASKVDLQVAPEQCGPLDVEHRHLPTGLAVSQLALEHDAERGLVPVVTLLVMTIIC